MHPSLENLAERNRIHHEHRGTMECRFVLHRMNEGHIINMRCQLWKQLTHPSSRLSMLSELPEALRKLSSNTREGLLAQFGVKSLTVLTFKFWFVVPCVHMAKAAWAKDLDHTRRTRSEIRWFGSEWVSGV